MRQRRHRLSLRGALILYALSGVLLILCFPPAGLWFLAWVALVPWLVAVRAGPGLGAALGSWLAGAIFFGGLLYWLQLFGVSVWILAALAEGLSLLAWGLLMRWIGRLGGAARVVGAGALWCGVEWVRGLGPFGFTWGWLGYSQSPALFLLPVARLLGTLGLSCAIAVVNAALAEVILSREREESVVRAAARAAAACGLVGLAVLGAHAWVARRPAPAGDRVKVAVVQGSAHGPLRASQVNEPLTTLQQRQMLDIYGKLTREAARERPALVVWPESVLPGIPEREAWIAERLAGLAEESGTWLLAGGPYLDARGRNFNAAYLYSPIGNLVARYDKVHLVPFGEYVPGRSWLPFLSRYHVRKADFAAGPVHRVLQAGTIAVGPMICFESIFPTISWGLARRGADVLVVMTNDAWFGRTAAGAQHLQISVLRAAETGRWVLRGASTGISAIIAPDGRVVEEVDLYRPGVLTAEIELVGSERAEPRLGAAFAWLILGLSVAYVIAPAAAGRVRGRRSRKASRRSRPAQRTSRRGRRGRSAPR